MKLIFGTFALVALAGCASMSQDPYAAQPVAPRQTRLPSSSTSCESLRGTAPDCQIGDSYVSGREPATAQNTTCKQTKYECQKTEDSCTENDGTVAAVDSFSYVAVGQQDCH